MYGFVDSVARESQQSSAHSNGAELAPRMTIAKLPSLQLAGACESRQADTVCREGNQTYLKLTRHTHIKLGLSVEGSDYEQSSL